MSMDVGDQGYGATTENFYKVKLSAQQKLAKNAWYILELIICVTFRISITL